MGQQVTVKGLVACGPAIREGFLFSFLRDSLGLLLMGRGGMGFGGGNFSLHLRTTGISDVHQGERQGARAGQEPRADARALSSAPARVEL